MRWNVKTIKRTALIKDGSKWALQCRTTPFVGDQTFPSAHIVSSFYPSKKSFLERALHASASMATTALPTPLNPRNDHKPYTSLRHPKPPSPTRTSKSSIGRRRTLISCSKRERHDAWKKKKVGIVDYDEGIHRVATQVSGLGRDDLPKRFRLRVDDDRFQRDWKISEVVDQILKLKHWEDVEGVLNRWAGRFARKNFPVLIRV